MIILVLDPRPPRSASLYQPVTFNISAVATSAHLRILGLTAFAGFIATSTAQMPTSGIKYQFGDQLKSPQKMYPNEGLRSASGQYRFIPQAGGNGVIYDATSGSAAWATRTSGQDVACAIMQADGSFVLYDTNGGAVCAEGYNPGALGTYQLVTGDDSTLVNFQTGFQNVALH